MVITNRTNIDGVRHYLIEGIDIPLPSVTTVIDKFTDKQFLRNWANSLAEKEIKEKKLVVSEHQKSKLALSLSAKYRNEAADFGKNMHSHIEAFFNTGENEDLDFRYKNFLKLVKPLSIETSLYYLFDNKSYGFAGTPDLVGYSNSFQGKNFTNELLVFDWKNPIKIKYNLAKNRENKAYCPLLSYYLQLSAYLGAFNSTSDKKANKALVVLAPRSSRKLYFYYLKPESIIFYWSEFKEMVKAFFDKKEYSWTNLEQKAIKFNHVGERLYLNDEKR
jgi:hypothetical protein